MTNSKAYSLILVSVVASFLGFWVENFFISFSHGFIDNRNMVLPFLFGYGLSILAYYFLFGTPNSPLFFGKPIALKGVAATVYSFVVAFLGVSIGEIIVGHLTEWACGIVWWNYSAIPLHITRYTSVPTSLAFASLITVYMKFFFDPLTNLFSKMHPRALSFLAITTALVLTLDMVNSGIYMFKYNEIQQIWKYEFEKPLKSIILRSSP